MRNERTTNTYAWLAPPVLLGVLLLLASPSRAADAAANADRGPSGSTESIKTVASASTATYSFVQPKVRILGSTGRATLERSGFHSSNDGSLSKTTVPIGDLKSILNFRSEDIRSSPSTNNADPTYRVDFGDATCTIKFLSPPTMAQEMALLKNDSVLVNAVVNFRKLPKTPTRPGTAVAIPASADKLTTGSASSPLE